MDIVQFFYVEIIPWGLWLIMFGLGMSLTLGDIKHVFVDVKAATIGLVGQLILLPALGFLLVETLSPAPAIAVGLIILTACPGVKRIRFCQPGRSSFVRLAHRYQ